MTQLELTPADEPAWTRPPTTRWCLVGEHGSIYRLTESGVPGDPAGAPPLEKAEHPDWLDHDGIGTTTTWGDGIAGFVWYLTMEADRRAAERSAAKKRPKR